jgi:prevent-host-death family protein
MRTASVTQVKNGLSALLDEVKAGETVTITERGVPIARIEPMPQAADPDGRLARLERDGLVRRGTGTLPAEFFTMPIPEVTGDGPTASELIIEERRSGW